MKFGPLSIVLFFMSSTAVWAAPGNDRAGFAALHGAAAAKFELPGDVRFMHSRALRGGLLTANRYQQRVGAADVLGGQLTVLKSANGDVTAVIGAHYPGLLSTNDIVLKARAAQGIAASKIGGAGQWRTQLMINPADGRYFYLVENRRADSRWFHWIDAEDGSVVNAYDGLTTGSGIGVHGDIKDLSGLTTQSGNAFEMVSADDRQTTYDAGGKSRLPGRLATDDNDNWDTPGRTSPGQAALVDAHFFANVTDDYLLLRGFNWMNHFPQGMVSSAHVKRNYNNAFWNGSQMAYGDGDGSTFIELSGDLDVVAHELSHGVTDATSDLIYQNESGALNEAFSDIMGTSVEFYYGSGNWTIGEDIMPNDDGIRDMANPGTDGDPSHYDERYTGTADNGGVHWNSGIANHWYYLLVEGGQNADSKFASGANVQGIGMAAAEKIAFDGFTTLNATADFCAARASTIAVAGGSAANVGDAWDEVGVDEALCSGGGGGDGGGGGGDTGSGAAPEISNVGSEKLRGVKFRISWDTDVASTTEVIFTCCGAYTNTQLVTSHSYDFNGSKGTTYEYYVASEDASGNRSTAGPFTHQN